MNQYSIQYMGNLRTKVTHKQNSQLFFTDAPVDSHGEGKYFSPTDLIAVSLGSCIMTLVAIQANLLSLSIEGAYSNVEKVMQTSPRRLKSILINIHLPNIEKAHRKKLENAAFDCPVYKTLHPELEKKVVFHWGTV